VDFDRRHVLSSNLIFNLPTLAGANGFLRAVAGGWETSTIVNYASGPALTIGGASGFGNVYGTGSAGQFASRPLRVLGQPCHLSNSPSGQWLNPAAFTWSGFQLGGTSNTGPGQCAGPPTNDVDFALDKNWAWPWKNKLFGENARIQLRLESFNLFNHPQFRFNSANLSYNVTGAKAVDAGGGPCSATSTACSIQGGTLDPSAVFGRPQFTSLIGNREIQYGLKIIF
jgi:hypothetical protein